MKPPCQTEVAAEYRQQRKQKSRHDFRREFYFPEGVYVKLAAEKPYDNTYPDCYRNKDFKHEFTAAA